MDEDLRNPSAPGPSPEDLFSDWPQLRPVDRLLEREARTHSIRPGLTDRVFRASVAHLPQPAPRRARSLLVRPLVPARLAPWGRLAMAASIAAAFTLAIRIQEPELRPPPTAHVVMLTPEEELVLLDLDSRIESLLAMDASSIGEAENIILTRETTFRDLADDVTMLAADMEM